ncbi:DEAD/DEAH box helicase [Reyranella sp.]|jgi:superfamily II DNA or RNA helicase|uniref:DEAD/DEAH box helicase n=1 Tax=Reyranella sp. TaxID=1929291 RepID=UPI000BD722C1|nr:DEAD/DEAH box helicase [Reyranella sp.]OYY36095.1 MAG: helicase [Rhodospirillales bacterium 35-66-84]OYZ91575.1 MAG: helicase [Rhodospirillales bacterium 24-66-33]OZB22804.1 MAG: helicase [Rhodospirillales bacterium 39-66-50]HQS18414.1 DEAD/DEAH box helicase [Reyranella sp.]HQT15148.1 DEAD/DEAH box helicase [Reyranella sp.]
MTVNFAPGDLVRARGREWVALPSPQDGILALRPLSGSENDMVVLDPALEILPVEPARFDLPADATATVQAKAALLADAMRLTLRRGAGPFRSAAQLAFEPRTYQLVPLLMALRMQVPRLLIADDVGIGKTIEAGLILRELMDRGEVDAFSVLCPPHLVEQWVGELKMRFGIEAVAVTSGSAARLERGLPLAQTLFHAYPYTVVSLDYIKAEKRREGFARACPDFVIVDEAHACVGTHKGKQQRFELLSGLARDPERRIILLTATPHSGDEEAFGRLLSLIEPSFGSMNFDDARYRERLARHFVQRQRIDLLSREWDENRVFPKHETTEFPYRLSQAHLDFQETVLDYCFGVVARAGFGQRDRRLAFWGTLALMRCVGSSPAAALSALRNRMSNESDRLEPQIYDEDSDDEDAVDIEPSTGFETDPALLALVRQAEELVHKADPKLIALIDALTPLIKKNANPVVFCRYLATAEHVRDGLRKAFPKLVVEAVTGVLTPDERRDRVADMAPADDAKDNQRILVATDCLSEGINLQQLFDTVIHYDLSWNPTRHQQREGRVDRFGQPAELVRSIMMFSPDSAIDGAVLEVILRKAEEIRKATGVTVPLPDERGPVTDALMASMMLRRGGSRQLALDLRLDDGTKAMEARWRDASESEKKSRARFAQNAMKPEEVAPEWEKVRTLLGSPEDAKIFIERAMSRFGVPLEPRKSVLIAHVHALETGLRERLNQRNLSGSVRLAMVEPAPSGTALVTRTHPLTATLAEALVEASLDPEALSGLGIGRVGAWPTTAVQQMTRLVLLRIRFKLTVHARKDRLLLAEEAALVAMQGGKIVESGEAARAILNTPAAADLATSARDRIITKAMEDLPGLLAGPLAEFVRSRAEELMRDHARLRAAAGSASRVTVEAVLPPDVIGLFVLMPSEA